MKLRPVSDGAGQIVGFSFYCPGCEWAHVFYTSGPLVWTFNGDRDRPSFTPSLKNTCADHPDPKQRCCHLVLTDGQLHYEGDCTHPLAGKTVELPDHWEP